MLGEADKTDCDHRVSDCIDLWCPPLFSQSYSIVLASRAGLGIGFGLINSLAVSMIDAFYHGDERASMIGFQSAFQGFGAALMTFVAGQLVQFGWQYTF